MMYFLKPKQYDAKLIACAEDCSFVAPHDDAPLHAAGAGELTGFGEFGEGYIRFALVQNDVVIRKALKKINEFLNPQSHSGSVRLRRTTAAK